MTRTVERKPVGLLSHLHGILFLRLGVRGVGQDLGIRYAREQKIPTRHLLRHAAGGQSNLPATWPKSLMPQRRISSEAAPRHLPDAGVVRLTAPTPLSAGTGGGQGWHHAAGELPLRPDGRHPGRVAYGEGQKSWNGTATAKNSTTATGKKLKNAGW